MNKSILREAALRHPSKIMQPYDSIINFDGFDAILAFSASLGGLTVYVPSLRTIFGGCLEAEAKREFKGSNFTELSRKYGFTERHLRRKFGKP